MAVLKEYACAAHGPFESKTGRCPHGCSKRFVRQEFRTAPATRSGGGRAIDRELNNLARDYRLSDIKTSDNGQSVMQNLRSNPTSAPHWGQVAHAAPGFSQRGDVKTFDPGSVGVQKANVIETLKPVFSQPRPNLINRPDPK